MRDHFVSRKDAFASVQLVVGTMADCLLQPSGTEGLDNSQPTANWAEISPEKQRVDLFRMSTTLSSLNITKKTRKIRRFIRVIGNVAARNPNVIVSQTPTSNVIVNLNAWEPAPSLTCFYPKFLLVTSQYVSFAAQAETSPLIYPTRLQIPEHQTQCPV